MKKQLTILCLLFMGLVANPTFANSSFDKEMTKQSDEVAHSAEHQADELVDSF